MTQNLQANIIKRWICFTCFTHTCSLVCTGNGWNAHWNTENVPLLPSPTSTDLAKLSPKKPGKETSWGPHFLLKKVDSWHFHVHLSKTMTWHIPSWQLSHPPRKALLRKNDFPNFRNSVGYWCSRRLGSMHLTKARMLRERQVQAISESKIFKKLTETHWKVIKQQIGFNMIWIKKLPSSSIVIIIHNSSQSNTAIHSKLGLNGVQ